MAAGLIAISATPAAADTTIGETFTPDSGTPCTLNTAILQAQDDGSPSYATSTAGTISSWSTKPDTITGTGQARLKVYRLSSGSTWTVVGESSVGTLTSNTVNTFATSIPVNAGDRIAILGTSGAFDCGQGAPAANVVSFGDATDHPPGGMETFGSSITAFRADVSAVLTPTPTPTTTGQRATALASCKKRAHKRHWSHKRLKKCKKKAKLLPI
jgi:hypothetical protein